jgi:hypothetical protein
MTFTDYLIDITLIGIVLVQIRGRRLTTRALLLPVGIVTYVAVTYLKGVPTAGNDLFLEVGCAALGALLGGLAGYFTSVTADREGIPVAKAGLVAAGLWILGTGGRLAFQVYASHGGGSAIERFSVAHSITSVEAWTSALILMALSEAVVRTGILTWRGSAARRRSLPVVAIPMRAAGGAEAGPLAGPVTGPVTGPLLGGCRTIMERSEHSY